MDRSTRSVSALESLPAELLQSIFLFHPNLNLPKASQSLGSSLASTHLKTEFVIATFTDPDLRKDTELQSGLLCQKWLTFEFFQHCQKTYMLRKATEIYRSYATHLLLSDQNTAIAEMTKIFDSYYNLRERLLSQIRAWQDHEPRLNTNFCWEAADGTRYMLQLTDQGRRMLLQEPDLTSSRLLTITMPGIMPQKPSPQLPEKLLHGPWTNERGYYLQLLLNSGMRVDSTNSEIASLGLEDAIREDNLCAIAALTFSSVFDSNDFYLNLDLYPGTGYQDLDIEKLTNPSGKWWFLSIKRTRYRVAVGVAPTTKHLRIAVLEKGCNLRVVKALVDRSSKTHVDFEDPEIVSWALERKASADKIRSTLSHDTPRLKDALSKDTGYQLLQMFDEKAR